MKSVTITLCVLILLACSKPQRTPFLVLKPDAHISHPVELYYLNDDYQLIDMASEEDENGNISFRKDSIPFGYYQLRINNQAIAPLIISDHMPFSISGDFNLSAPNLTISGNEATKTLWQLSNLKNQVNQEIAKVVKAIPDSTKTELYPQIKDSINARIQSVLSNGYEEAQLLLSKNAGHLVSKDILQLKAGNHYFFDPAHNSKVYAKVSNDLLNKYPDYPPILQFKAQVDSLLNWNAFDKRSREGSTIPSISVPDAWGEVIRIDSLIEAPTLLVIWNSQQEASREITKQLMRWSRSYRNKGLKIVMLSTDKDRAQWLQAIKDDRLALLHLSDLKGEDSPVIHELGLPSIPQLLLIDSNKKIVKRCTELEMLHDSLQQLIKN